MREPESGTRARLSSTAGHVASSWCRSKAGSTSAPERRSRISRPRFYLRPTRRLASTETIRSCDRSPPSRLARALPPIEESTTSDEALPHRREACVKRARSAVALPEIAQIERELDRVLVRTLGDEHLELRPRLFDALRKRVEARNARSNSPPSARPGSSTARRSHSSLARGDSARVHVISAARSSEIGELPSAATETRSSSIRRNSTMASCGAVSSESPGGTAGSRVFSRTPPDCTASSHAR